MNAQGWYLDPYHRHQDRWFSDGQPTALVRDGRSEASDPPPDMVPNEPLVRSELGVGTDATDLVRVGAPSVSPGAGDAAFDLHPLAFHAPSRRAAVTGPRRGHFSLRRHHA